jgi:hypothetical protein
MNYGDLLLSMGILHVMTSIIIVVLPVKIIMRLKLSKSNKIIIIGMFAMGGM